jgi:hypothetical protein
MVKRFQDSSNPLFKGSLVESPPVRALVFSRPAAYLCLPLFVILVYYGFAGLIGFDKPETQMPLQEFLSKYFLDCSVRVVYCFGLVMCGLSSAELAGKLFGLTRFRSAVVFSWVKTKSTEGHATTVSPANDSEMTSVWKPIDGVDEQFSAWVKDSSSQTRFEVEIWWGELLSEAESPEEPRYMVGLFRSDAMDAAMSRIMQIPFRVGFEAESTPDRTSAPPDQVDDQSEKTASDTETI